MSQQGPGPGVEPLTASLALVDGVVLGLLGLPVASVGVPGL